MIKVCKKQGWYDQVNSRKVHSGDIPRLGSVGFVPVFIGASLLYLAGQKTPLHTYLPLFAGGLLV
ncbi:MAG: undecaprenyl/decaprenyl-phosphate alpha-N-acetylglucosaminyl 1-phosphate transferase, partial [Treponema sp.]|nr:undecaprenyl/decaprenyl-phosphate alpha-N-acetylglucosaminyl 1-phosphate transferase [Treponema sp.]